MNVGGGKAVIFADSKTEKTEELLRAYAMYINILNELNKEKVFSEKKSRFITSEDVGVTPQDLAILNKVAGDYIVGVAEDGFKDPSNLTSEGIFTGIQASVKYALGKESVKDLDIYVQGLGNVGYRLVDHLVNAGARVSVYDLDEKKNRCVSHRFGVKVKTNQQILRGSCDVFVPCALGAVINSQTVKNFKCRVIAGSANNQLAEAKYGDILKERGILYAPDYVINSGGLISAVGEILYPDIDKAEKWSIEKAKEIYNTLMTIYEIAERENIGTHLAADNLAKAHVKEAQQALEIMKSVLIK